MAHRRVNSGDQYYEDVDPRFTSTDPNRPVNPNAIPSSLTPGHQGQQAPLEGENGSYESLQEGSRSPAASEASHFTSVSQRGVNPNWRPGPHDGMMPMPLGPARRPGHQDRNMLLDNNPDFNLPGMAPPGGRRGPGGGMGGSPVGMGGPMRGGSVPPRPPSSTVRRESYGVTNPGRYPTPDM